MKKLRQVFSRSWRPALIVICLALIAFVLYFHRLGSLLPGYSATETTSLASANNWHKLVHNPVNAPYKVLLWAAVALGHHSLLLTRFDAAIFGTLAAVLFFMIVRWWHGYQIAFLSTAIFASSAGLLHVARFGSPQILQMGALLFMGAVLWYRSTARPLLATYCIVLLAAILCYIPGLIWFEFFGLLLLRRGAVAQFKRASYMHQLLWAILFLALIAPLGIAAAHTPKLALSIVGLPQHFPSLGHICRQLVYAVSSIGIRSNGSAAQWLGHMPLLDVIELVLGLIGVYYYLYSHRSVRSLFLAGSAIISLVLIGLAGIGFASLVPFVYLFVAAGLHQFLGQWLTVFPRNPLARFMGVGLICLMLFFSALYQVRSYFVAWPHAPATRQVFDRHEQ